MLTIHRLSGWPGFDAGCDPTLGDRRSPTSERAPERDVVDAVWAAIEPRIP